MPGALPEILLLILTLTSLLFLIVRLRFFSDESPEGRYPIVIGSVLVLAAAIWQVVKASPEYSEWFIVSAYPYITLVQICILGLGILFLLVALALHHDYWESRRDEITARQGKLAILDSLQDDTQRPYQVVDLLDVSLREILLNYPGCAGAVFLLHRKRRQFILTGSSGLNKQETALMEYFPLRRNIVSEAVEAGQPVIGGEFRFVDRDGERVESRFRSTLVLPMISAVEKLGGIILFSEEAKYFASWDVKVLSPVAGFLAEKVRSARLNRELVMEQQKVQSATTAQVELSSRLLNASEALGTPDPVHSFCRSLVGLLSATSVHLCSLYNGSLQVHGGSEPLLDLSDNFRAALGDAVDRAKPLILNQEAQDEGERVEIIASTLVFPLPVKESRAALLLRKEAPPFSVDNNGIKMLEIFAHLAQSVMLQGEAKRLDINRRAGLDRILKLLAFDESDENFDPGRGVFIQQVAEGLPGKSIAMSLVPEDDLTLKIVSVHGLDSQAFDRSEIRHNREGLIGRLLTERSPEFMYGRRNLSETLGRYPVLSGILSDTAPVFGAVLPLSEGTRLHSLAVFLVPALDMEQRTEWQRMLVLAAGLYSLRLSIRAARRSVTTQRRPLPGDDRSARILHRLNNHFSAILGNAELVRDRGDIAAPISERMGEIIRETERAVEYLRESFQTATAGSVRDSGEEQLRPVAGINETIHDQLQKVHISGNVYMAGGRPREINTEFGPVAEIPFSDDAVRNLFESALDRFAALSGEDELITIATYQARDAVYLDISRHARNFPPVRQVADFGQYEMPASVLEQRPGDVFLSFLKDRPGLYAHDRHSQTPTYLSFKFPLKPVEGQPDQSAESRASILVIDDEAIIRDLIGAMCLSMGYDCTIASSGDEGLRKAAEQTFDLVLTDLAMPGISGLELARRIRRDNADVPIVLVTGWEASLDRAELEQIGISEVLAKPFRVEQLADIIKKHANAH